MRALRQVWLPYITVLFLVAGLSATVSVHGNARHDHRISLLIIDPDSYLVNTAVKSLDLPDGVRVQFSSMIFSILAGRPGGLLLNHM